MAPQGGRASPGLPNLGAASFVVDATARPSATPAAPPLAGAAVGSKGLTLEERYGRVAPTTSKRGAQSTQWASPAEVAWLRAKVARLEHRAGAVPHRPGEVGPPWRPASAAQAPVTAERGLSSQVQAVETSAAEAATGPEAAQKQISQEILAARSRLTKAEQTRAASYELTGVYVPQLDKAVEEANTVLGQLLASREAAKSPGVFYKEAERDRERAEKSRDAHVASLEKAEAALKAAHKVVEDERTWIAKRDQEIAAAIARGKEARAQLERAEALGPAPACTSTEGQGRRDDRGVLLQLLLGELRAEGRGGAAAPGVEEALGVLQRALAQLTPAPPPEPTPAPTPKGPGAESQSPPNAQVSQFRSGHTGRGGGGAAFLPLLSRSASLTLAGAWKVTRIWTSLKKRWTDSYVRAMKVGSLSRPCLQPVPPSRPTSCGNAVTGRSRVGVKKPGTKDENTS